MAIKVSKKEPKKEVQKKTGGKNMAADQSLNESEIKAAQKEDVESVSEATSERLNRAIGLVSQKFKLDDSYSVRQFKDTGKVLSLTLENEDFIVAVTVKDGERHGLYIDF